MCEPLRSRLEAIQKLKPPKMIKGCRSFVEMVNFVSIFCLELQKLLKPIYDLTRKGKQFIYGEEQQSTSQEIKSRLQKTPVLHLPDKKGRFQLYSDSSKIATGSALYQIQNGKPKFIAYASKRHPEAVKNYSITELERCGLAINIASFAHLLKKVDFDAVVDHLALTHIMRSKVEPSTTRFKRLLEVLISYSFYLYYMKGKDLILSDFLSRQKTDDSHPHDIILISFNMRDVLREKHYNFSNMEIDEKYLVQTRSQMKSRRIKLPEVHGKEKHLDLHIKPGRQKPAKMTDTRVPISKPRIGQDRLCFRRKERIILPIQTSAPAVKSLPETVTTEDTSSDQTDMRQPIGPRIETSPILPQSDLETSSKATRFERK